MEKGKRCQKMVDAGRRAFLKGSAEKAGAAVAVTVFTESQAQAGYR